MSATNEPVESQPYEPAQPHAESSGATPLRRPRRRWALWIIGISVLLIFVAQTVKPWSDAQLMNMVSYGLGGIALLAGLTWTLRRPVPSWQRWLPVGVFVAAVGVLAVLYELVGVNGELVPLFEYRFASRSPAASEVEGVADLQSVSDDDFTGFLGNQRDGVIPTRAFSTDWTGAKELWRQPVGAAWSGFVIVGDYAVTMEQRGEGQQGEQWVTCYRIADGQLVWYHASPGAHFNPLGGTGPRSTPTVFNGRVYAQDAVGKVVCLDGKDGQLIWQLDLWEHAGLDQAAAEQAVTWGRAGSPLIVPTGAEAMVVVPYGGPLDRQQPDSPIGSLIALDADSGAVRWIGGETQISYASPIVATLDGQRQIVSVNESNVTGHAIDDGSVLWEVDWPGSSSGGATCSNAVVYGEDGLLLGKGYGGGSQLLRIDSEAPPAERAEIEWADGRMLKTKFTHAVLDGDFAYALSDGTLECVDLRGPERMWRQPRGSRYGQGQMLRVEDTLVVQVETGEVALVSCQSDRFVELARLDGLDSNTWNYPAVSGRRLLVRSSREAVAYLLPPRSSDVQNQADAQNQAGSEASAGSQNEAGSQDKTDSAEASDKNSSSDKNTSSEETP
ncbi:outer membrane protein assembly factor BamB family protein [Roseimaritima ulvae]|uniref:Outer membrane biogenesis protein BamB n=1 Tax=Roseimaritima ulvae TaxID=980254 RepID=A0A5B9QW13_9BACT|nr:PQQ-binding-like beta-propeller repeat protein [Roseimaritima ulvae]QEG41565.1 outer membrane biogenesis protein BamB [Roseimaritima ulvae]